MADFRLIFSESQLKEAILRISQALIQAHPALDSLVFVGVLTRGFPIAERLSHQILELTGVTIPVGRLDVSLYRDDLLHREAFVTVRQSDLQFGITDKTVILVDDVLFRGRTIRAALSGIADFGSPDAVELAVLIDRGGRKLPIFATYVGQHVSTTPSDHIQVKLFEIDGCDEIVLITD